MDGDIEELFESLIKKYREQDAAFDELKLMMDEDEELKKSYEEWCAAMGCSEKKGFGVFYQEYRQRRARRYSSPGAPAK